MKKTPLVLLTGAQILALPMAKNDAKAKTIRQYLCRLALGVALDGECFDGKRPFGNSDWQDLELIRDLISGGAILGAVDDGWPTYSSADSNQAIKLACKALENGE